MSLLVEWVKDWMKLRILERFGVLDCCKTLNFSLPLPIWYWNQINLRPHRFINLCVVQVSIVHMFSLEEIPKAYIVLYRTSWHNRQWRWIQTRYIGHGCNGRSSYGEPFVHMFCRAQEAYRDKITNLLFLVLKELYWSILIFANLCFRFQVKMQ